MGEIDLGRCPDRSCNSCLQKVTNNEYENNWLVAVNSTKWKKSVGLHEEASIENEQTLANLGNAEEATSKDEVDLCLCSFAFFFGRIINISSNELGRPVWENIDLGRSYSVSTGDLVQVSPIKTSRSVNPLSSSIKLQILLLCFHTFLTEVVGRSC